jgi:hypothetical protein
MSTSLVGAFRLLIKASQEMRKGNLFKALSLSFVVASVAARHYDRQRKQATKIIGFASLLGHRAASAMAKQAGVPVIPMRKVSLRGVGAPDVLARARMLLDQASTEHETGDSGSAVHHAREVIQMVMPLLEQYPYHAGKIALEAKELLNEAGASPEPLWPAPLPEGVRKGMSHEIKTAEEIIKEHEQEGGA